MKLAPVVMTVAAEVEAEVLTEEADSAVRDATEGQ
jgi:hypothetical protein